MLYSFSIPSRESRLFLQLNIFAGEIAGVARFRVSEDGGSVCESNPRINVNSTTYSAADGMKYTVLDVRQRERHGNSTGKVDAVSNASQRMTSETLGIMPKRINGARIERTVLRKNGRGKILLLDRHDQSQRRPPPRTKDCGRFRHLLLNNDSRRPQGKR